MNEILNYRKKKILTIDEAISLSELNFRRATITAAGLGGGMLAELGTDFDTAAAPGVVGHNKVGAIIKPIADFTITSMTVRAADDIDFSGEVLLAGRTYWSSFTTLVPASGKAFIYFWA